MLPDWLRLRRLAPQIFQRLDVDMIIEFLDEKNWLRSPHKYWRITKHSEYFGHPHLELTNIDTGAQKVLSVRALHDHHEFQVVEFQKKAVAGLPAQ
ncbi:MAG: hypothetical protein WCP68_19650, partial [Enhydrobacter sp.]